MKYIIKVYRKNDGTLFAILPYVFLEPPFNVCAQLNRMFHFYVHHFEAKEG
jgi:hypothetical protein